MNTNHDYDTRPERPALDDGWTPTQITIEDNGSIIAWALLAVLIGTAAIFVFGVLL